MQYASAARPDRRPLGPSLSRICIDARHTKAVLKMHINKSDRNDAIGIARIMQIVVQRGARQGSARKFFRPDEEL